MAIARKIRVDEGDGSLATRLKEVLGEIEHKVSKLYWFHLLNAVFFI